MSRGGRPAAGQQTGVRVNNPLGLACRARSVHQQRMILRFDLAKLYIDGRRRRDPR